MPPNAMSYGLRRQSSKPATASWTCAGAPARAVQTGTYMTGCQRHSDWFLSGNLIGPAITPVEQGYRLSSLTEDEKSQLLTFVESRQPASSSQVDLHLQSADVHVENPRRIGCSFRCGATLGCGVCMPCSSVGQHLELAGGLLFMVVGLLRFPLRARLIVHKVHLTAKFAEDCRTARSLRTRLVRVW
jgi:hypothetical protein